LGCTHRLGISLEIPFDTHHNQSMTYAEVVSAYRALARQHPRKLQLQVAGQTDIGEPLQVAVLSSDGVFNPEKIRRSGKRIILIINGIHPGEPEGIDATFMFLRDMLSSREKLLALRQVVLVVIPVYNIDGCLNRNTTSRANQNGPESYGFRGNSRNFDLNRDFIKADTRNAQTFHRIFARWKPDILVDNHTSNGADYPYVMTLIATQHNKLEEPLGVFLREKMMPALFSGMESKGIPMSPYVDFKGDTPETGLVAFMDYPRYSTGFAALWNCIGFMPETHMLKPFKDRLWATYNLMETICRFVSENREALGAARAAAVHLTRTKTFFPLDYRLDTTVFSLLPFRGYTSGYKPSDVSGQPRLWYDQSKPYSRNIPYFDTYRPGIGTEKPAAYIIPRGWHPVVERLKANGVSMQPILEDTTLETESYFIREFQTRQVWEGHYFHYATGVEKQLSNRRFQKGDWWVPVEQEANRFIVETLEPQAPDSWFAWNYFDSVLGQKEYFSGYVFEDLAAEFLAANPSVRAKLEEKKRQDPEFALNGSAQLDWVYRQSPWYESTHRRYPVARVLRSDRRPSSYKSDN
jgi:hypothetical protein